MTAYGDGEIAKVCAEIYGRMGLSLPEDAAMALIGRQRERVADSLEWSPFDPDGEIHPERKMQDSEKFLRERRALVRSWRDDDVFTFGVDLIDSELGGVHPGEICVVTGAQGSMKTSLAIGGAELALSKGMSVMFFSLDMDAGALQERRILRRLRCGQSFYFYLEQAGDDAEIRKAEEEIIALDRGKFYLCGNYGGKRIDIGLLQSDACSMRPQVMVVDYLTLLAKSDQNDLKCVNECMDVIVEITQKYKIRTILLSQMGRASKTEQARGVTGGHGKGGGKVEERADMEIELIKDVAADVYAPEIIATITKNRRGVSGISFSLEVDAPCYLFTGNARRAWRNVDRPARPLFTANQPGITVGGEENAQANS
jgi:replicative DNA helicase